MSRGRLAALAAGMVLLALPALGFELALPGNARQTVSRDSALDVYAAPIAGYDQGNLPTMRIEGPVQRSAWRINAPGLTPLQVMRPLRAQLEAAGFELLLDCVGRGCGGFDFRFATETLPGPHMLVNIRAFHFVTAQRKGAAGGQEVITILTSATATAAYVQIIQASSDAGQQPPAPAASPVIAQGADPGHAAPRDLASLLQQQGHAVLDGLDFATGSTDLGPGPFAVLSALAAHLAARPDLRVALVGHTDSVGGLAGNITLSRARAASVRQHLIDNYGIAPDRLDAEGMGYLAPLTTNASAAGREINRRVEVVVLGSP